MNNRDEDLTLENVDERVEHLMREGKHAGAPAPLAQTVRDLQRVYAEKQRLEQAWERIRSHSRSLESTVQVHSAEKQSIKQSFQGEQKTMRDTSSLTHPGSFQDGPSPKKRSPRRRGWLSLGMGLAAAVVLIAVFTWVVSPVFHGTQAGSGGSTPVVATPNAVTPTIAPPGATPTPLVTPQPAVSPIIGPVTPTPVASPASGQLYTCQYFTVEYPSTWKITNTGSSGAYLQMVQFRPSQNSTIQANAAVLYNNDLSAAQLLQQDADVQSGKVESTSTVTYNGLTWTVDIVNVPGSDQAQAGKFEIAYSNQIHPYRMKFAASPSQFATYALTFKAILASFKPAK